MIEPRAEITKYFNMEPQLNTWFPGLTRVLNPNGEL